MWNMKCSVNEKQNCTHWKQHNGSDSLNPSSMQLNSQILHLKRGRGYSL